MLGFAVETLVVSAVVTGGVGFVAAADKQSTQYR